VRSDEAIRLPSGRVAPSNALELQQRRTAQPELQYSFNWTSPADATFVLAVNVCRSTEEELDKIRWHLGTFVSATPSRDLNSEYCRRPRVRYVLARLHSAARSENRMPCSCRRFVQVRRTTVTQRMPEVQHS
jgi:hypothetical protein